MKIKVTEQVTKEVELTLPAYRKFSDTYIYKIISDTEAISAQPTRIGTTLTGCALSNTNEATEAEFNALATQALNYFKLTLNL